MRTNKREWRGEKKRRAKYGIKSSIVVTLLPLNPKPWNWNWWNSCSLGSVRFVRSYGVCKRQSSSCPSLSTPFVHFITRLFIFCFSSSFIAIIIVDYRLFSWILSIEFFFGCRVCASVCIVAKPNISDAGRYRFFVLRMWYVHGWLGFASSDRLFFFSQFSTLGSDDDDDDDHYDDVLENVIRCAGRTYSKWLKVICLRCSSLLFTS